MPKILTQQDVIDIIAKQGYIKPDANRNVVLAQNPTLVSSTHNFITADNAILENSHDCDVSAKNVEIRNCVEVNAQGADHLIGTPKGQTKIGEEANYATVTGDAHVVRGYGSFTSGVSNKNFIYAGVAEGNNITLGDIDKPNNFQYSTAKGSFIDIQGNHCHVEGSWIKVVGDNITVRGSGIPGTFRLFTTPGDYVIDPK
jgi:hypothetical protein